MNKTFLVLVTIILAATPLAGADATEYIIPFVEAGAVISVVNGEIGQNVTIETRAGKASASEKRFLKAWQAAEFTSTNHGYVRVVSTYPVHAWSVVAGTTFPVVAVGGVGVSARVFNVFDESGIAIANPHSSDVRVTFWMFTDRGTTPWASRDMTLAADSLMIGFFRDLVMRPGCTEIAGLGCSGVEGFTVVLASESPLAVGVARCREGSVTCETVPTANYR